VRPLRQRKPEPPKQRKVKKRNIEEPSLLSPFSGPRLSGFSLPAPLTSPTFCTSPYRRIVSGMGMGQYLVGRLFANWIGPNRSGLVRNGKPASRLESARLQTKQEPGAMGVYGASSPRTRHPARVGHHFRTSFYVQVRRRSQNCLFRQYRGRYCPHLPAVGTRAVCTGSVEDGYSGRPTFLRSAFTRGSPRSGANPG
jgi:hypothetical protein